MREFASFLALYLTYMPSRLINFHINREGRDNVR